MKQWITDEFWYLHGTFHDSSVIAFARLNAMLGVLWVSLQGVDVSAMKIFHDHPEYLVYYIIFSNGVNEMLRRNGASYGDDGKLK
jgi:hypothetical protein